MNHRSVTLSLVVATIVVAGCRDLTVGPTDDVGAALAASVEANIETAGSAVFGNGTSLSAGVDADWDLPGDFTVEWFQYQTNQDAFPRVFSIGSYADVGGTKLGFSVESGTGYVWFDGAYRIAVPAVSCALNAWTHVAITRSGTALSLYYNGVHQQTVQVNGGNISAAGKPLVIGREENPGFANTYFKGNLTNFHFVNGTALYTGTGSFTPPSMPIQPVTNTKLLLKFSSPETLLTDVGSLAPKTITAFSTDAQPSHSVTNPFGGTLGSCGGGGGGGGGSNFPGRGNGDKKGVGSGPGQGVDNGGKKK